MKAILFFDLKAYARSAIPWLALALLMALGLYGGSHFNLSVGEGVYLNAPYSIGFLSAMLTLIIIFIATIIGSQLLFSEWDHRMDLIVYATPLTKQQLLRGRFTAFFITVLFFFSGFYLGFAVGQNLRSGSEIRAGLHLWHYLWPYLLFGVLNTLFLCSFLSWVAWVSRNKMMVIISGLLLYVLYMVLLIFSNSPFMNATLPQSAWAATSSALFDPFGVCAYFHDTIHYTVDQRNQQAISFTGFLLLNRILFWLLSVGFLYMAQHQFAFSYAKARKKKPTAMEFPAGAAQLIAITPHFNWKAMIQAILSFARTDLVYLFKGNLVPASSLLLLFFVGMEMFGDIEKSIRIPEKYATPGLLANTINANFFLLGALFITYFTNDIFWRSHSCRFAVIQNATCYHSQKLKGHWLSMTLLIVFFTFLLVLEALIFQTGYGYLHFDLQPYLGVVVFNTLPLTLLAGILLLLNAVIRHKTIALGATMLFTLLFATPLSKMITNITLLQFLSGFQGVWSDFNGYGSYLASFAERWVFGLAVVVFFWLALHFTREKAKGLQWLYLAIPAGVAVLFGFSFMDGYDAGKEQREIKNAIAYEQQFTSFRHLPQPDITAVTTTIDLFPQHHSYTIRGTYVLRNSSQQAIHSVLLNFPQTHTLESAVLTYRNKQHPINQATVVVELDTPMAVGDSAMLHFKMKYRWHTVNGHEPMNAIIANGSFMRISRYYPAIGYQVDNELQDKDLRIAYGLGKSPSIKKLEDPHVVLQDAITLDMTISAPASQTAIGTGTLVRSWQAKGRNYFHYRTQQPVPFRFALSSARYASKKVSHKGKTIHVFYSPKHARNVQHLIENTRITLDYCEANFGEYPFGSITFAEISSFTRGFNATAYPATIFMNEATAFHSNFTANQQYDVINELAGHEVAHFWWGTTQMNPDQREGATFLTETLAMYTEMMVFKKMHGKEKMMEKVQMYQDFYEAEKGFSEETPLYRVRHDQPHIYYYKGAVAMVGLSQLIGEEKVNEALRNFLHNHQFPACQPVSTDLVHEILNVTDKAFHQRIKKLFLEI
ncbi:MAG: M1 family aminopeptidase [Bacteroidales bacterium]